MDDGKVGWAPNSMSLMSQFLLDLVK